jgi:serine O-acetyltransferase
LRELSEQLAKMGLDVEVDEKVGEAFDVNYLNKIVD